MTREILKHKWWTSYINPPYFYLPNYHGGGGGGSTFKELNTSVYADFRYDALMGGTHSIIMQYCDGEKIINLYSYADIEDIYYNDILFATITMLEDIWSKCQNTSVKYYDTTPHKGYIIFSFQYSGERQLSDIDVKSNIQKINPTFSIKSQYEYIQMHYPIDIESELSNNMRFYWRAWLNLETLEIRQCAYHYHKPHYHYGDPTIIYFPDTLTTTDPMYGNYHLVELARGAYDTDEYSSRVGFLKI